MTWHDSDHSEDLDATVHVTHESYDRRSDMVKCEVVSPTGTVAVMFPVSPVGLKLGHRRLRRVVIDQELPTRLVACYDRGAYAEFNPHRDSLVIKTDEDGIGESDRVLWEAPSLDEVDEDG
jgi:hypothetical protein